MKGLTRAGLVALAIAIAAPLAAQESTTGAIEGQVVDAQGLPIPGATVTVTSPQGARTFITDADGRFLAPFLTPGTYTVGVELAGFQPTRMDDVQVRLGQRTTLGQLTLRVAGGSMSVTGQPSRFHLGKPPSRTRVRWCPKTRNIHQARGALEMPCVS